MPLADGFAKRIAGSLDDDPGSVMAGFIRAKATVSIAFSSYRPPHSRLCKVSLVTAPWPNENPCSGLVTEPKLPVFSGSFDGNESHARCEMPAKNAKEEGKAGPDRALIRQPRTTNLKSIWQPAR
jgi:hypothetical protein